VSFDPVQAAEHLADRVPYATDAPKGGWPATCPARELARSPAAAAVGHLAARSGLGLFHTEWRRLLALPEDWVPAHDPSLAEPPSWGGGVLPERKYQAFRHDQALGGYHPGMRAKWTAHELCHGLVGFAWRPDASPLFLATAGRIAELVPVVLWYFLDEAHLRRCPRHSHGGALYRSHCPACEAIAAPRLDELFAEQLLEEGRLFVERELAGVRETLRTGVPVPHVHGGLDLCSDGVAYAAAHGPRLHSEAFHRYIEGFAVEGGGLSTSLEALTARALEVLDGIAQGDEVVPLAPTRAHGEARWALQDLAWRLLTVWHDTDGDAADTLSDLVDGLAEACALTARDEVDATQVRTRAAEAFQAARAGYEALFEDYAVPEPADVFALGHDLLGVGGARSEGQILEGLVDAMPGTITLLQPDVDALISAFVEQDRPVRVPLGRRFASWIAGDAPPEVGALARFEAALTHLPPADPLVVGLGGPKPGDPVRLAEGVVVLREDVDVVELARSVEFGDVIRAGDRIVDVDGQPVPERPSALVLVRDPVGEVILLDVEAGVGDQLLGLWDGGPLEVAWGEWEALVQAGVLRPVRWGV